MFFFRYFNFSKLDPIIYVLWFCRWSLSSCTLLCQLGDIVGVDLRDYMKRSLVKKCVKLKEFFFFFLYIFLGRVNPPYIT